MEQVKPVRFSAFLESVYNGSVTEDVVVDPSERKLVKPELPSGEGSLFRIWEQVGSREQTSSKCQAFLFLDGCSHTENHDRVVDGVLKKGGKFMRPVFNSCDKPTCCKCVDAWAGRQARKAETRLDAAVAKYGGKLEHIVLTFSAADYGLPYEVLKEKARKGLLLRGIVFGAMVPHAFRGKKIFREGFHFHLMASFRGEGYDRCRKCVQQFCSECTGYEGLTRRLNKEDGLVVKVLAERRSAVGTLAYELNHSSVMKGVHRFHVLTYFGLCAYNNMGHVEDKKALCPLPMCHLPLVRHNYIGVLPLSAFKRKGSIEEHMFEDNGDTEDFVERGKPSGMVKANPYCDGGDVVPRSGG